jgi:uncharacterized protein (UPF0147 family)
MLQKLKEQLPTILITVILVVGAAYFINKKTLEEVDAMQQAKLTAQREQFDAQLKATAEDTRHQIEGVDKLLKDAIQKRSADVFMSEDEMTKLNAEKVDALAAAIAKKVQPFNNLPKSAEEAEKMQNEQVDKVSSRMADKISPILTEMSKDQNLTRDSITSYSQRISDQVGRVLTDELSKNQQLNNNLAATQTVAEDSLKLSHEITALYLSSFKDQGLITRLLTLPANVVRDAANLSIISSNERKKVEQDLVTRMNEMDKRLADIQTQAPKN